MTKSPKQSSVRPPTSAHAPPDRQREVVWRAQAVGQQLREGIVGVTEAAAGAVTQVLDLGLGILRAVLGR